MFILKMKRRISVITGTRAEYGILRPVLQEIQASKKLRLYLIVTGTHLSKKHGLTIREIRKDGFPIHAIINMMPKGDSTYFMSTAVGKGIEEFSRVFQRLNTHLNLFFGLQI